VTGVGVSFDQDERVTDLVRRTERFVRDVVVPEEDRVGGVVDEIGDPGRIRLQDAARDAGVFAPHVSTALGGHGLSMTERAPVFEAAGYSLFGPLALNIAAPDEGNMHLLAEVATGQQSDRFLAPLARGEVRSAFAMTEPTPGAGSDPSALTTRAVREGDGWWIDGTKHFITGADGAGFFIVMARTSGEVGTTGGATMFLVDADTPGITVGRHIRTMDRSMIGGHCEVAFDRVRVDDEGVLGGVDEGFRYAQVRLGPARMTHCMRWLGAVRRAHDVAVVRASEREVFGSRLVEQGLAQQLIADSEIDIEASRALILSACADLDADRPASASTSIAKTFVAEATYRIADRAVQLCGGLGVSHDLPTARILDEVRPFRVYDGPSEVHRWSIARRAVRRIVREHGR
jgi:acyl-CoA dehydrogenase